MTAPIRPVSRVGQERGFTLVELMIVIAMIGVMAAIATVGYRKYLHGAHTSDAKALMSAIRVAQESMRAETLNYMDCGNVFYPRTTPNDRKTHFHNPSHGRWLDCWQPLNVITDSPTLFVFATQRALVGQGMPAPVGVWSAWPTLPGTAVEPTYIIEANGDQDANGATSRFMTSSFNGEIYVEDEWE